MTFRRADVHLKGILTKKKLLRNIVGLSFISFIDLGEPYFVAAGSGVDKITGTRKNPTQTLAQQLDIIHVILSSGIPGLASTSAG